MGDVITAVGSHKVTSTSELKAALADFASGDTTTLTVYRSGESLTLNVTFDERINNTQQTETPQQTEIPQQDPQQGLQIPSGGDKSGGFDDFFGGNGGGFWPFG